MADKGLKRICPGCSAVYYDFNKRPIICPSCGEEFTGDIKVRSRRSRAAKETVVKPAETEVVEAKVEEAKEDETEIKADENTVELEALEEGSTEDDLDEDLKGDLDLDELAEIDDIESDDDLDDDDDDAEDAVIMSLEQFNGLMETVHLLKSPANAAHLSKSIKQYHSGKTKQHGLVDG